MGKKFSLLTVVIASLSLQGCSSSPSGTDREGIVSCELQRVKDGDSVLARCDGQAVEIRLYCIDAPELSQKIYGVRAKKSLKELLGGKFNAHFEGIDRYQRTLATLWRGDQNINLEMVRTGRALVYRKFCEQMNYLAAEVEAEERAQGVWDGQLPFVRPWEWRSR